MTYFFLLSFNIERISSGPNLLTSRKVQCFMTIEGTFDRFTFHRVRTAEVIAIARLLFSGLGF